MARGGDGVVAGIAPGFSQARERGLHVDTTKKSGKLKMGMEMERECVI